MEKTLTIRLDNESGKLTLDNTEMTYDEGIACSLTLLELLMVAASEAVFAEAEKKGEDIEDVHIRGELYDRVVVEFSNIMNRFFPERQELYKKTPEALLEEIDSKLAILNEANKQATT